MAAEPRLKVGLALGGGAARGIAHVGVLRALVREQIPIHVITGTSMGSIIGGAFAAGGVEQLEESIHKVLTSVEFKRNRLSFLRETKEQHGGLFYSMTNLVRRGIFFGVSNLRPSFLSAEEFAESMHKIIPDVTIEELSVPFGAVAMDLSAAEEVLLTRGSLRRAADASSAIPGILPPVQRNGRMLIDGGWMDKIPVLPAFKLGADVVIAVDITADLKSVEEYKKGVDIMVRANAVKDDTLVGFSRRMANILIEPDVGHIHWADFGAFEKTIELGDAAATQMIPKIRELLQYERFRSYFRSPPAKKHAERHLNNERFVLHID
jgi:NTE family protein